MSVSDLRLPLTLEEEVRLLRDQVTSLQQRGTEQLSIARAAALETAAKVCDAEQARHFALRLTDNGANRYRTAERCAQAIRELAKR